MLFYKTAYIDEVAIGGQGILSTTVTAEGVVYIACSIEGQPGWTELTEAEYLAAGCTIPKAVPTAEGRLTQLEQVVDALLTGGVTP